MTIKTGLVLSGGGARAAYQVGVIQAIADILPRGTRQPFPIITGTSAGALNALALAGRPGTLRHRAGVLANLWSSLESESIYRTNGLAVAKNAVDILWSIMRPEHARQRSLALLNNQPLRELLTEVVHFTHIERAIDHGELEAIGLSAMNYANGHSTTFYQGQEHITPWSRARRMGVACTLGVEHLLASSALPTLFPATRIGRHYFGDGALRQSRPLSAAIHLGADRLFIIGVSEKHLAQSSTTTDVVPPTIAQVLVQMLNAVFLDSVDADLESLHRINTLLAMQQEQSEASDLSAMRLIDTLTISPSQSLAEIAREYQHELPSSTSRFLRLTGSIRQEGPGGALSYILFEPGYCQRLLELGYHDAMDHRHQVIDFFDLSAGQTGRHSRPHHLRHGPTIHKPLNALQKQWHRLTGKSTRRI